MFPPPTNTQKSTTDRMQNAHDHLTTFQELIAFRGKKKLFYKKTKVTVTIFTIKYKI